MPDLGAVIDAPIEEVVVADEVVEQPGEVIAEPEAAAVVEDVKGDERVMPQWIKNLKATDPLGFKAAKADFFGKRAIDEKLKDFDLDGTKSWLTEVGGREAVESQITELQGKAAELDSMAAKMANGDESLITDIAESSPEGFIKLARAASAEYQKRDPEGWSADMSAIMAATIQQNGIPMFLEKMALYLEVGKTDQIAPMLQQLKDWAGSFNAKATAQRTVQPTAQPNKLDAREQALNQREEQAFTSQMKTEVDTFRSPLISKELESYFKRRPNDNEAKELAINTVRTQVIDRMSNDAAFQKSLTALTRRKDREGAMKLIKSRESAAIADIAPKVGRTIYGNPAGAQPVVKQPAGTPSKADVGWSFTDKPPAPHLIDRGKTSDAMIMRGKFILKDGSKQTIEA